MSYTNVIRSKLLSWSDACIQCCKVFLYILHSKLTIQALAIMTEIYNLNRYMFTTGQYWEN